MKLSSQHSHASLPQFFQAENLSRHLDQWQFRGRTFGMDFFQFSKATLRWRVGEDGFFEGVKRVVKPKTFSAWF